MNFNFDKLKEIQLSELTLDSIGNWPLAVRIAGVLSFSFLLLCVGLWTDTRSQLNLLTENKNQEIELKKQFELKQQSAAGLQTYKLQLEQMDKIFSDLLKQLPGSAEVPGLLEDISKQGLESGLEFHLIKPMPEISKSFYIELPFEITGYGTYHQIADFLSKVSALPRIVTFQDFSIINTEMNTAKQEQENSLTLKLIDQEPVLNLSIIASTFRYIDNSIGNSS